MASSSSSLYVASTVSSISSNELRVSRSCCISIGVLKVYPLAPVTTSRCTPPRSKPASTRPSSSSPGMQVTTSPCRSSRCRAGQSWDCPSGPRECPRSRRCRLRRSLCGLGSPPAGRYVWRSFCRRRWARNTSRSAYERDATARAVKHDLQLAGVRLSAVGDPCGFATLLGPSSRLPGETSRVP